jgi:flagellar biosynthetic protein FliR
MHASSLVSEGTLFAFLVVLTRVSGALVLVPLPGMQGGTEMPRIIAALAITVALYSSWPRYTAFPESLARLVVLLASEAAFGLAIGISVGILNEILKMGAQVMSQQAGYGFASTIDPTTSADSGVLVVIAGLMGGIIFLALGLDHVVIRAFALSLVNRPPGEFHADEHLSEALWRFSSDIFSVGVRLALPAIALLGLIDISLALVGRINAQLHLISLSFPMKMMTVMALIGLLAAMYPRIMRSESGVMIEIINRAAGIEAHAR